MSSELKALLFALIGNALVWGVVLLPRRLFKKREK